MTQEPTTDQQARDIEARVGHPGRKWDALVERIQADAVQRFSDIQGDWLDLMWTLDMYRRESVPPERMGNPDNTAESRITAIAKGKGNWFATVVALLLENQTTSESPRAVGSKASRKRTRSTSHGR